MTKVAAITPVGKHDYLTECIIEGLLENGCQIVHTDAGNGLKGRTDDGPFIDYARNQADIVLVFWSKKRDPGPRRHLLKHIDRPEVTGYVDGSEYNCTGYKRESRPWLDPEMAGYCGFYFKRECRPQDLDSAVIPLPFACRKSDFSVRPLGGGRPNDIFVAFGQNKTDSIRAKLEEMCRHLQMFGEKIKIGPVEPAEYRRLTYGSKICVNAHGGGEDCMRFWEILASGSACFSQRFNIVMPNPFTDGKDVVFFDTVDEFRTKAYEYLADIPRLADLALSGYRHARDWHSTKARARYLLEAMGQYPVEGV